MPSFHFRSFTLDLDRYELAEHGKAVALPRIAMELLILLVRDRGTLVSRERIAAALWPGRTPSSVAQGLNTGVNRLREVFRDDPAAPAFIQTVIGKGYRFVAEVTDEVAEPPQLPTAVSGPVAGSQAQKRPSLRDLHAWYASEAPPELIKLRLDPQTSLFTLRGPLTLGLGLKHAEMEILTELNAPAPRLILDLSQVPRADSAGLGLLIHLVSLIRERQGELRLCGASERLRGLLQLTQTEALFHLDDDLDTSLAALDQTW